MFEELKELYIDSGFWAHPILISTIVLFVAGWIMLFTVRLIKRFVFYSFIALLLPNSLGVVGYVENLEDLKDLKETVVERGQAISDEVMESAEDLSFSPIYLGFAGSVLTVLLGLAGIVKLRMRGSSEAPKSQNTA